MVLVSLGILGNTLGKIDWKSWKKKHEREVEARADGSFTPAPVTRIIAELSVVARHLADRGSAADLQAARLLKATASALGAPSPDAKALGAAARLLEKAVGRPRARGLSGFAEAPERLVGIVESELSDPKFTATGLASLVCELGLTDPAIRKIVPFGGGIAERKHRALHAIKDALGSSRKPSAENIVVRLAAEAGLARPSRLFAAHGKRVKRGR